jgi:hypothetical protein
MSYVNNDDLIKNYNKQKQYMYGAEHIGEQAKYLQQQQQQREQGLARRQLLIQSMYKDDDKMDFMF